MSAGPDLAALMNALMNEMAAIRREKLGDDLTSQLLDADLEDGAMTGAE